MSGIQSINSSYKKPFLRADNTGYTALVGMGLTTLTAMSKSKTVKNCHKPLAFVTACLSILHLGVITHNRMEWNSINNRGQITRGKY